MTYTAWVRDALTCVCNFLCGLNHVLGAARAGSVVYTTEVARDSVPEGRHGVLLLLLLLSQPQHWCALCR